MKKGVCLHVYWNLKSDFCEVKYCKRNVFNFCVFLIVKGQLYYTLQKLISQYCLYIWVYIFSLSPPPHWIALKEKQNRKTTKTGCLATIIHKTLHCRYLFWDQWGCTSICCLAAVCSSPLLLCHIYLLFFFWVFDL